MLAPRLVLLGQSVRLTSAGFWLPAALISAVGAVLRLQLASLPISTDEAGYAEVARLWSHGGVLYQDAWVDRPQLLIVVFRLLEAVDGSATAMRILATALGVALAIAAGLVARDLFDDRVALLTVGLASLVALSPFIEAFTLNGELIAAVPATLGMWLFVRYLERRHPWLLIVAGFLGGCALMIKQSAFDALITGIAYLLWRERGRGLRPVCLLAAAAALPVLAAIALAPNIGEWWEAVVAYRGQGDSLLTASAGYRLTLFLTSLSPFMKALGVLIVLTPIGRRQVPPLIKIWLAVAVVGVLGGGNFHSHYYVQLVAPLSVFAAVGLREMLRMPRARAIPLAVPIALLLTITATMTAHLYAAANADRTVLTFHDPHLLRNARLADYVRSHTSPRQSVLILSTDSSVVYWLAERPPAIPYLWPSTVNGVPDATRAIGHAVEDEQPSMIVLAASTARGKAFHEHYRTVARLGPDTILLAKGT
jgi:hypothetical protein